MGTVKDLAQVEGVEKLKELAEDINICMFCTSTGKLPFKTRPMATQKVDDEGNFWFLSAEESDKNDELQNDSQVQLIYAKPGDSEFLSVIGTAQISKDKAKIEELWTPIAKAWFTDGKEDPRITVIRVRPTEAYYWDTLHGKVVSLLGIAASALTGKTMDNGVEGVIRV